MDVFAKHEFSWLHAEKVFIEDCIQAGKKVLGICLGAQLASWCLGAMVGVAPHKEIGWFPVTTTKDSERLPWFHDLFAGDPVVLHWHGDKFQIPYGGFELLQSAGNRNQAFLYDNHVLGLQFHLETTGETLALMIENCGDELQPAKFIQSENEMLSGLIHIKANQYIMTRILDNFLNDTSAQYNPWQIGVNDAEGVPMYAFFCSRWSGFSINEFLDKLFFRALARRIRYASLRD